MNCLICGGNSSRYICGNCTKKISIENPLLITKSVWVGEGAFKIIRNFSISDPEKIKVYLKLLLCSKIPYLTNEDLSVLNEIIKIENSIGLDDEGYKYLSILFFRLHLHYKEYLRIYEVDDSYYLGLAKKFLSKAISINRSNKDLYEWGMKLAEFENNATALREEYLKNLVAILEAEKDYEKIVLLCEEYLRKYGKDKEILKILGKSLMSLGRFEEAQMTFLRAIELQNDDWESWYLRGISLEKLGKYGGAIQSLQTSIVFNPDFVDAYRELVKIFDNTGQHDKAQLVRRKYLERFGDFI